jgi:hypothetical protein
VGHNRWFDGLQACAWRLCANFLGYVWPCGAHLFIRRHCFATSLTL